MTQYIIAPVDGSPESWRGAQAALQLARRTDRPVIVLGVEYSADRHSATHDALNAMLAEEDVEGLDVSVEVRHGDDSVAAEIEAVTEEHPGAAIVMASHGRGRSSAIVGSVADDVLQRTFGPVILVGPHAESFDFNGPVLITVDGSDTSEHAVPLGVAWAIELGEVPWVVHAARPIRSEPPDTFESAYIANVAARAREWSEHDVEFEEIHGQHPESAVADYAGREHAGLIVAASHGRTGLERLTMGSVASGFVRNAPCPVMIVRVLKPQPAHH